MRLRPPRNHIHDAPIDGARALPVNQGSVEGLESAQPIAGKYVKPAREKGYPKGLGRAEVAHGLVEYHCCVGPDALKIPAHTGRTIPSSGLQAKKRRCFWHRRSLGRKRPRKQCASARLRSYNDLRGCSTQALLAAMQHYFRHSGRTVAHLPHTPPGGSVPTLAACKSMVAVSDAGTGPPAGGQRSGWTSRRSVRCFLGAYRPNQQVSSPLRLPHPRPGWRHVSTSTSGRSSGSDTSERHLPCSS
jgi:hypothetical protein